MIQSKKILKTSLLCFMFLIIYIFSKDVLCFNDSYSLKDNINSVHIVSCAKIGNMGDLLMHSPLITAYYDKNSNSHNFENIFSYMSPYIKNVDYSVINMEGTLSSKNFSGYPCFRCPECIIDHCGFDMFLTANNHSYDARSSGFHHTSETLKNKNVDFIGTRLNEDNKKYIVKEINGIKLGMINYTYGTINKDGTVSVNGIPCNASDSKLLNVFDYNFLDTFFDEQETLIANMKKDGADKIIYYMHWGNEYQLKENSLQRKIAQKLCDLGVDVIIGGHPHVVQPMDLLHSKISGKDTICIYSTGNAISNQRRNLMNLKTGHTEDGVFFTLSFTKYSDGNVLLSDVEILPTWVNLYTTDNGKKNYQILPLDKEKDWTTCFGLSPNLLDHAEKSYERTMAILGSGFKKAKNFIRENLINSYPNIYTSI